MTVYIVERKDDKYRMTTTSVDFIASGIWVNNDYNNKNDNTRIFMPWHNVNYVIETV